MSIERQEIKKTLGVSTQPGRVNQVTHTYQSSGNTNSNYRRYSYLDVAHLLEIRDRFMLPVQIPYRHAMTAAFLSIKAGTFETI